MEWAEWSSVRFWERNVPNLIPENSGKIPGKSLNCL